MRVPLNLATAPFVPVRRFLLTVGVLGVVALAATLLVSVEAVQLWRGRTATQARMRELQADRARLLQAQQRLQSELEDPATQEILARTRFMNDLVRRKNLSWAELFFDLEERLPPRVRILAVAPSLRDDGDLQVELQVGSESAPALIEFLQALEEGKKFREIALRSQNRSTGNQPDAVTAQVSVVYVQE